MYPWYMESIWWVFKQLFTKGLVYQGVKVMPYSTACNTPLSNFESGQNYKDTIDPSVVVNFPILDDKDGASFVAWTTTPWTLPSNLALCVNPNLLYVKVQDLRNNAIYILMEARLESIFKSADEYKILDKMEGKKLEGINYKPLFTYFVSQKKKGAFRVLCDDYVSAESGTGIVHQAPYFGEDDFRICLANGIIARDQEPICPVDGSGKFVSPVEDFKGEHVKNADSNIIKWLKKEGRLVNHSQVKHSYPFCWRSDTPLIYKAVPSWFIRVEQMVERLLNSSGATYWVPEFVRDKRFGNWLKDARDWAVSRNRYWGTPIPLWISPDGSEIRCIGSIAELEKLTGKEIKDLHRESIDDLTIPSKIKGNPPLRRIPEVFDCWFESGSMPYAQQHYPFENVKVFQDNFPADFIAEGIDQTRGWFYTLIVLSTALFDKPPFKNLIANGLVLASDGQKMSKRKKNYPDPMDVVKKYGADALRLYLINSPVVRAENLRFKEEGVRDIIKDVFLPWFNAFRFLMQNIEIYVKEYGSFQYDEDFKYTGNNIMDRWILSSLNSLIAFVATEMKLYHLYTVVPRLTIFIDHLTNWYVRMNRKRFKGAEGHEDTKAALSTLFNILFNMVKLMAPFTPFLVEYMYQNLKQILVAQQPNTESVHYLMMPRANAELFDMKLERLFSRMQDIVDLGRILRDRKTIPVKYPLPEIIIINHDSEYLDDVSAMEDYIKTELNVKKLTATNDKVKYGVSLRAEPDHKILGARLRGSFKAVSEAIKALTDDDITTLRDQGWIMLANQRIEMSEIRLVYTSKLSEDSKNEHYEVESFKNVIVLLNCNADEEMKAEGIAREIINRVQKLRKKARLVPTDTIKVYYKIAGEYSTVVETYKEFIEQAIKASFMPKPAKFVDESVIISEEQDLKGSKIDITITSKKCKYETPDNFITVVLKDIVGKYMPKGQKLVMINLTNGALNYKNLYRDIERATGCYYTKFAIWYNNKKISEDSDVTQLRNKQIEIRWQE